MGSLGKCCRVARSWHDHRDCARSRLATGERSQSVARFRRGPGSWYWVKQRRPPPPQPVKAVDRTTPPERAGVDAGAGLATDVEDAQRSADTLLMQLIVRIRSSTRSAEGRGVTAEGMANEQNYYLDGWVDAVLTLSPDRLPQLRRSMEEAMCGAQSAGEAILLSRLAARIPELASTWGLGCILEQAQAEDAVLAEALDAYRRARLPASPAWESWRARATTAQIQRRFQPWVRIVAASVDGSVSWGEQGKERCDIRRSSRVRWSRS